MFRRSRPRLIALDITSQGFAYVVLEGPDRLIDWGATKVPKLKPRRYRAKIKALFERFLPSALVLENPRGAKGIHRSKRVVRLLADLERFGCRQGLKTERVSREKVKEAFAPSWRKHEIAQAISRWFPVLDVPPPRRPWEPEREAMNVFDALSFALTAFGAVQGEVR
jgi:hypothetical protein